MISLVNYSTDGILIEVLFYPTIVLNVLQQSSMISEYFRYVHLQLIRQQRFIKSMMSIPRQKQIRLDILMLGSSGNGKTYFMRQYIDKQQDPKTLPTIAVDFRTISLDVGESQPCKGFLWDSGGVERFDNITSTYIKNKFYFIIFVDVTNRYDLQNIERFVRLIGDNCSDMKRSKILILGNKIDLLKNDSNEMLQIIKKKYLCRYNFMVQLVSCKYNFKQAKYAVENFFRKCYEEQYRTKMLPTIIQFMNELALQPSDNSWFNNHEERQKVKQNSQDELKKKKNNGLVKVLKLAIESSTKINYFSNHSREQLDYVTSQFIRIIQDQDSTHRKEIEQIKAKNELLEKAIQKLVQKDKETQIDKSSSNSKDIIQVNEQKHRKQLEKLQDKLMEYEYWIVEADRLHNSLSQAIANSPLRDKFAQFKQIAQEVNSTLEEQMGFWQIQSKSQKIGGSFIQSGIHSLSEINKHSRVQRRSKLQQKLQILEQIIEELAPTI